jgi:hypothetical protein
MPALPHIPVDKLPDKFFLDVAIGVQSFEVLCNIYEIDAAQASTLATDAEFVHRLHIAEQAVADEGTAFRARCRTIVNDALPAMEGLMRDPNTPPSVQLETFKSLAKFGALEPKQEKEMGTGTQLVLTIIAPDGTPVVNIGASPQAAALPAPRYHPAPSADLVEAEWTPAPRELPASTRDLGFAL